MQDSEYNRLKSELISIDFIDVDSKEIKYPPDFLADYTLTFANLQMTTYDNHETFNKKVELRAELRERLETEILYVRYLKVGNTNTNKTYDCIYNFGGSRLKWDLKGRYNLKSEDIGQLKIIQEQLADVCFVADKLLEFYERDYLRMRDEDDMLDKECNIDRWAELMTRFGVNSGRKSGTALRFRTSAMCDFGENIYLSKKLLGDIRDLFGEKKRVIEIIIKELEPKNTKIVKQQEQTKGYDLGIDTQLETIYKELMNDKFLDKDTKVEHFKNAFNGEPLVDFVKLKWRKQYYASIVIRHCVEHDTPWQVAVQVFDNGSSDSLKNAYKPDSLLLSINQKNAKLLLDKIFKSLP